MEGLRELLLLIESLILGLGSDGLALPPRPSILYDAGSHFFIRLIVAGGPHLLLSYEVLHHSFGEPLAKPSLGKSVRVEDPRESWEIGILEDVSDDAELTSLWRRDRGMSPELFRLFARRGYTGRAVLFRCDRWDPSYVTAHRQALLWESYSEGVTRYALPLRDEQALQGAFALLLEALGRHGIRPDWQRGILDYPEGSIAVETP